MLPTQNKTKAKQKQKKKQRRATRNATLDKAKQIKATSGNAKQLKSNSHGPKKMYPKPTKEADNHTHTLPVLKYRHSSHRK